MILPAWVRLEGKKYGALFTHSLSLPSSLEGEGSRMRGALLPTVYKDEGQTSEKGAEDRPSLVEKEWKERLIWGWSTNIH